MQRLVSSLAIASALTLAACSDKPETDRAPASERAPEPAVRETDDAQVDEARALTKRFAGALKAELLAALETEGGAAHAVAVCRERAPAIAESMSTEGWTIARTAPRVRNPSNAAEGWRARGLSEFAEQIAGGAEVAGLEWHELEGDELHYMRAIPMGGLCLGCHGAPDSLDPKVREQLATLYPDDQATGFAVGELRGAFVVSRAL